MRYLDDSKLEQIRDAIYNMSTNGLRIWSILDLFQCQTDAQEENMINEQIKTNLSSSSSINSSLV